MSQVSGELTGIIIGLWRTLLNNWEVIMSTSYLLLRNQRHRATTTPAKMEASENFSDESGERFYSVRINRMMSPIDSVNLGRPCNSLFQFQVAHQYVF